MRDADASPRTSVPADREQVRNDLPAVPAVVLEIATSIALAHAANQQCWAYSGLRASRRAHPRDRIPPGVAAHDSTAHVAAQERRAFRYDDETRAARLESPAARGRQLLAIEVKSARARTTKPGR
jgi:hypothetical protein